MKLRLKKDRRSPNRVTAPLCRVCVTPATIVVDREGAFVSFQCPFCRAIVNEPKPDDVSVQKP
jgi:hypothetical protein